MAAPALRSPSIRSNMSDDPFSAASVTSNGSGRGQHRYSSFDTKLFQQYNRGSPTLAKRQLETNPGRSESPTLEQQKQELSERIREVERAQADNEIGPELQQKLADLEMAYHDIEREAARQAPKSPRKAVYEGGDQAGEGSYFGGDARGSPTKPQAASRRQQRGPTSGRVHDIEFATEISTSLLAQLRHIQGVLAEKEEALTVARQENAKLQQSSAHFDQRLRELEDTEQRHKDQAWHLETQVQELNYHMKDANLKEQRLTQHLNAARFATSTVEREYDELRQLHDQLSEEHGVLRRDHDNEITGLQRALASGDNERIVLTKRLEELAAHNEQLENNLQEQIRAAEAAREYDMRAGGDAMDYERPLTPEGTASHSPVKATPRVGNLESETLKSSLNHAHRMIQNLKNNIHREKTEKLELKRMLQDVRDELEARRADVGGVNPAAIKRRKQTQQEATRNPTRNARLGAAGGTLEEIIDDPTWEEYEDSPTRPRTRKDVYRKDVYDLTTDASDAFETANEDGTETEGFQTADDLRDSDGDLTETESPQQRRLRNAAMQFKRQTSSFESTASDDEAGDLYDLSTPPSNHTRYRTQLDKFSNVSEQHDSPASFVSRPSDARQNLAAELDDLDNSSIAESTPGQRALRSRESTPQTATPIPMRKASLITQRAAMVDSGMMTEPYVPEVQAVNGEHVKVIETASGAPAIVLPGSFPSEELAVPVDQHGTSEETMASPELIPLPRSPSPGLAEMKEPANLQMVPIVSQHIEPVAPVQAGLIYTGPANVQHVRTGIDGETISSSQSMADGIVPMPININGAASPVSSIATPMEGQPQSSIAFVKHLVAHPPGSASAVSSQPSVQSRELPAALPSSETQSLLEEPYVRDFAISTPGNRPADGIDTNKVLLEPQLRVDRDRALNLRQFQEPTLQVSTPSTDSPADNDDYRVLPRQLTTAEKGKKKAPLVADSGTQTLVSADQIDNLLKERRKSNPSTPLPSLTMSSQANKAAVNAANGRTLSLGSTGRPDAAAFLENAKRPSSTGSSRRTASPSPQAEFPPLPTDHREVIAAASRTTTGPTNMPPPPMPPSAWRPPSTNRSRTPNGISAQSPARQPTNTTRHQSLTRSEYGSPATRRSSVSSLQSELDERFGLAGRQYVGHVANVANIGNVGNAGHDSFEITPNTDPRMIQAITQTMIGEFLWKYTRRAGRSGEHSENRHKRFFWIHPYTRTLYWSQQDPSQPSQKELKAKSVPIQAVRVISDENVIPPGLHNKSLVVVTPSRSIKFTAPTAQRHETWFNALSYLLLRRDNTSMDEQNIATQGGTPSKSTTPAKSRSDTLSSSNYTAEDIAEFNPSLYSRSGSRGPPNASRHSLNNLMGPPATPRSNAQSSTNNRNVSPQRTMPQQQSIQPGSTASRTAHTYPAINASYNSVSQGTIKSIAEDRPMSSTGFAVPDLPRQPSPQRAHDSPVKQQQPHYDNEVDAEGFKKPRPVSTDQPVAVPDTPRSGRTSRLGSLTGGWRASLFGRGRSKSRGRSVGRSEDLHSTGAYGADGTHEIPPVPTPYHEQYAQEPQVREPQLQEQQLYSQSGSGNQSQSQNLGSQSQRGGWGGPATINGIENVRACCDGKHDVGDLSHHHHHHQRSSIPFKILTGSSRSRDQAAGSTTSRYSQNN